MINTENVIFYNKGNFKKREELSHDRNPLKDIVCVNGFLDKKSCNFIIKSSEEFGKWGVARHKNYPTTDIPIQEIIPLNKLSTQILRKICYIMKKEYNLEESSIIEPFDVFVVKYELSGQKELELHRDVSVLSFVLLLSNPNDFEGGGTYYKENDLLINQKIQGSLVIHCGKTRHSGKAITAGKRYILIGFCRIRSKKILEIRDKLGGLTVCDKRFHDYYWIGHKIKKMKIYIRIINLKKRKNKLKIILNKLKNLKIPEEILLNIGVYIADEGNVGEKYLNWNRIQKFVPNHIKKYYSREITNGEVGCYNSHTNIIKKCENVDYLLILEDDADFPPDLIYRLYQTIDELKEMYWDAVDFGAISLEKEPTIKSTESTILRGKTFQAHCILYSSAGISKIKQIKNKKIVPYDDFLNAIRGIHYCNELNNYYENGFCMFFYYLRISKQCNFNIHDTENIKIKKNFNPVNNQNIYKFFKQNIGPKKNPEFFFPICKQANEKIWNFQLSNFEGSFDVISLLEWEFLVKKNVKLVLIYCLSDDSSLEIFTGKIEKIKTVKNDLIIFPSYILFRCKKVAMFLANGNSFI